MWTVSVFYLPFCWSRAWVVTGGVTYSAESKGSTSAIVNKGCVDVVYVRGIQLGLVGGGGFGLRGEAVRGGASLRDARPRAVRQVTYS